MNFTRFINTGLFLGLLFLGACSSNNSDELTEVGRWADDSIPALYIVHYADKDLSEPELQTILKPVARELSARYAFVVQVAVYDPVWAEKLASEAMQERIQRNELLVGSDMVLHDSMTIEGGLVYTYYKDGDYDEFIYHAREVR